MVWVAVACSSLRPGLPAAEEPASQAALPAARSLAGQEIASVADTPVTGGKIEEDLERPINVAFLETPLSDSIQHLGKLLRIPIRIDRQKLYDTGIALNEPVTVKLDNVAARCVLDVILLPRYLEYAVVNGVLLITVQTHEDELFDIRTYDITKLLSRRNGDSLKETIQGTLDPDSWDMFGGAGTIFLDRNTLVVRQRQRVHRELRKLLAELVAIDNRTAGNPTPDEWILRTYSVGNQPARDIASGLQQIVSPKSWQAAGGKGEIRVVGNMLFIRQTRATHWSLQRLLRPLVPPPPIFLLDGMPEPK